MKDYEGASHMECPPDKPYISSVCDAQWSGSRCMDGSLTQVNTQNFS